MHLKDSDTVVAVSVVTVVTVVVTITCDQKVKANFPLSDNLGDTFFVVSSLSCEEMSSGADSLWKLPNIYFMSFQIKIIFS